MIDDKALAHVQTIAKQRGNRAALRALHIAANGDRMVTPSLVDLGKQYGTDDPHPEAFDFLGVNLRTGGRYDPFALVKLATEVSGSEALAKRWAKELGALKPEQRTVLASCLASSEAYDAAPEPLQAFVSNLADNEPASIAVMWVLLFGQLPVPVRPQGNGLDQEPYIAELLAHHMGLTDVDFTSENFTAMCADSED